MTRYDEAALVGALNLLSRRSRVAFAAACAGRLLPLYDDFERLSGRGDPAVLREAFDYLVNELRSGRTDEKHLEALLERVMAITPREDDLPWIEEQAYAEDAAASVAYAIRAQLTGKAEEAAWAARRCYEAADRLAISDLAKRGEVSDDEEAILQHPLVQAELNLQLRQLKDLEHATETEGVRGVVEKLTSPGIRPRGLR